MVESATYEITPGKNLELRKGSIADHLGDAIFFLNLSSTRFLEYGPVMNAICDKDDEMEKPAEAITILDAVQEYTSRIPDARIVSEKDRFSDLEYHVAEFNQPKPYDTCGVDVSGAGWENLKYLIFGNIGNDNEGVLVQTWQPSSEEHITTLCEEIDSILRGAVDRAYETGVQSLAMPVLTGQCASSSYFFAQLGKSLQEIDALKLPPQLIVYAYSDEDYQQGVEVLGKLFNRAQLKSNC